MASRAGSPNKDKPFREALRMELAAAGDNLKELRKIARTMLNMAVAGDVQAIKEVADRLDGKPAQETNVTVERKPVEELSDAELARQLAELTAEAGADTGDDSASVH